MIKIIIAEYIIMSTNKTENKESPESIWPMKNLPKNLQDREQLKQAIQSCSQRLIKTNQKLNDPDLRSKIQQLQLRLRLIEGCEEMSLLRLSHLQEIFKHYCIHIFKTGKHMTFDRLEYQKVHLTMERFFLFLKDFELIIMRGSQKKEEVVQKNAIITVFKKISSNCRDLSFEQFIQMLQKLAIMYFNEKQVFYEKKKKQQQQKQNRKKQYERRKKMLQKRRAADRGQSPQQQNQNQDENEEQGEEQGKQEQNNEEQNNNENDDLVNDMINDKDLEDPNEQVNKITNRYALEREQQQQRQSESQEIQSPIGKVSSSLQKNKYKDVDDEMLMILTTDEKIQFYYQDMIKVDSVNDYRQKLTALNLPIFQKNRSKTRSTIEHTESKARKMSIDQSARVEELRKKMDQKKLKQKASPIPKPKNDDAWNKAQEEKRKKRQLKKQRQQNAKKKSKAESDALAQKKIDSIKATKQKKTQFNEKSIDFTTLGKISIDQLKLKQFNPNRYYNKDDDDSTFLDQYEGNRPRIASGMAIRERNSLALVNDMKKRVNQMEQKQKKQEKDLDKKVGKGTAVKNRF